MEQIYIYVIVGIIITVIIIAWWYFSQGGSLGTPNEPSNFEAMDLTWKEWWANKVVVSTQHSRVIYKTVDGGDSFYWALVNTQIYISLSKATVIAYLEGYE